MKKLILLRHAKSSWDDPSLEDHDRPLNARGRAAAPVIAAWLLDREHVPDTVLCSSSIRTRETVEAMRKVIGSLPEPLLDCDLYHASAGTMLDRLRKLPADCATAMVVGHQPGIGSLVRQLADGREKRRCKRAFEHFPTAAAAVFEIDADIWSTLDNAGGYLVDFARPRDLMEPSAKKR